MFKLPQGVGDLCERQELRKKELKNSCYSENSGKPTKLPWRWHTQKNPTTLTIQLVNTKRNIILKAESSGEPFFFGGMNHEIKQRRMKAEKIQRQKSRKKGERERESFRVKINQNRSQKWGTVQKLMVKKSLTFNFVTGERYLQKDDSSTRQRSHRSMSSSIQVSPNHLYKKTGERADLCNLGRPLVTIANGVPPWHYSGRPLTYGRHL